MAKSTSEQLQAKLRDDFVDVAPGLAMPAKSTVRSTVGEYDVEIDVVPEAGRLVASEVRVSRRPGGPAVSSEAIRSVPVAALTKQAAVHVIEITQHEGYLEVGGGRQLTRENAARLRENGPTSETLDWVAYLYRLALLMGEPPTQYVERALGIPRSTAGRWVAAARSEGLLGKSEGSGKAGG